MSRSIIQYFNLNEEASEKYKDKLATKTPDWWKRIKSGGSIFTPIKPTQTQTKKEIKKKN